MYGGCVFRFDFGGSFRGIFLSGFFRFFSFRFYVGFYVYFRRC